MGSDAPERLFYATILTDVFRGLADASRGRGITDGLDPSVFATAPDMVAVSFDASPYLEQKFSALAAHRSAFGVTLGEAGTYEVTAGNQITMRPVAAKNPERLVTDGPAGAKGYPAISPGGRLLAYGIRMPDAGRALRPIVIVSLPDGTWRHLGDDCGGRPCEWVDDRRLIIERFARLNSIALIDTETGDQHELLESAERSVSNPRLSPDRRWIAFDASHPGEPARTGGSRATSVCVSVPRAADSRVRVGGGRSVREPSLLVCGRTVTVLHTHGHEPAGSQCRSGAAFSPPHQDWWKANRWRCTRQAKC